MKLRVCKDAETYDILSNKIQAKKALGYSIFPYSFSTTITLYSPYTNFDEGYSLYILIVGYGRWVPELFSNLLIILEHGSLSIQ